jgi:hypothetical protein
MVIVILCCALLVCRVPEDEAMAQFLIANSKGDPAKRTRLRSLWPQLQSIFAPILALQQRVRYQQADKHVDSQSHSQMCMHTYTHTHTHTHIYTGTHSYMHTHALSHTSYSHSLFHTHTHRTHTKGPTGMLP